MFQLHDYNAVKTLYKSFNFHAIKIVVTGTGRVGNGACKVLEDMGIKKVSPNDFLQSKFTYPVYTLLGTKEYYKLKTGGQFGREQLIENPLNFESAFMPYAKVADILIHGIYWEKRYPLFFNINDMRDKSFKIEVIADIACDIAPDSSIPCTIRASTIENPVYGFDPYTGRETPPYLLNSIDIMAIDNLPSELPRDASTTFGEQLIQHVIPALLTTDNSEILDRATIVKSGKLTDRFTYLSDYIIGR
jgi:alanine dehydrogenase